MKILNFGSLNIDYVYQVDHMLQAGETESSAGMETFCGGKGLNQSIALAKAGADVYHAGLVGEEGAALQKALRDGGVKTEFVRISPGRSGHTIIQVDAQGQNSILLFGGANQRITREYVDEVLNRFDEGDGILLQNEINEMPYIMDSSFEKGMRIFLNPSPFDQKLKACDMGKVSLFLLNEIEGEQMTGHSEPGEILRRMKEQYPHAEVVLTLGSKGCIYQKGDVQIRQGIFPVKAVDTTAAGDTFTGYFIASLTAGIPVQECLRTAAKASAIAVTKPGASASIPSRTEVENSGLQESL